MTALTGLGEIGRRGPFLFLRVAYAAIRGRAGFVGGSVRRLDSITVLAKLEGADRDAAEKLIEELGENLKGARISRGWVTFEFDGRAMLPEQARARAKRIKAAAFGRVGVMGFMVEAAA